MTSITKMYTRITGPDKQNKCYSIECRLQLAPGLVTETVKVYGVAILLSLQFCSAKYMLKNKQTTKSVNSFASENGPGLPDLLGS